MNNVVFVVLHTTIVKQFGVEIETDPMVLGVFRDYETANNFLDPILDNDIGEDGRYNVIERELV